MQRMYMRRQQNDMGLTMYAVSAVHDGYVLQKSITRNPIGGSLLTQGMLRAAQNICAKTPGQLELRPRYSLRRNETSSGTFEVSH